MDNPIIESPKVDDEEAEVIVEENVQEAEIVTESTSPPTILDYGAMKIARDAKAKRKDEKTVQQVLKSLDDLTTPEEKLSAMCKKYSELLHENRLLQGAVKQSEKNIILLHREKERFRNERSKATIAKERMEQLCRELQKFNKAQQEEAALKLRVEKEKAKEVCITFQSAFAEMNTLTNQNNEKSAKLREENLDMIEKIKFVKERIESTEAQLDEVRQQAKFELELEREKLAKVISELTLENRVLTADKEALLMKMAQDRIDIKGYKCGEQYFRGQITFYEKKFQECAEYMQKTEETLKKHIRPDSREMKKKMSKFERDCSVWKQRWEKTNAAVIQIAEMKEKRDAEIVTLQNKLSTLQELCKVFQRERTSLIAQLREKNHADPDRKAQQALFPLSRDEYTKSMKQVENISNDCEKLTDNLKNIEGSLSEAVRIAVNATVYDKECPYVQLPKRSKKVNRKTKKNEARNKSTEKKEEKAPAINNPSQSNLSVNEATTSSITEPSKDDQTEKSLTSEDIKIKNCAAEIAILERHETVLKDIGKVLAEQAELEAKIACVQEIDTSINEIDSELNSDNKQSESSSMNPEKSDSVTTTINPENKTVDDDSGVAIAEFEIVDHGSCEPDGYAVSEADNDLSFTPDNDKIIDHPEIELSLPTVDSPTIFEAHKEAENVSDKNEITPDILENSPIDMTSSMMTN